MNSDLQTERFIQSLTDHQGRLFVYLVSMLGDVHDARNVLQETNMELWRKSDQFIDGTDFAAWSRKIAHFKILAFLRDKKRDRHMFDEALINQLAQRPQSIDDDGELHVALRHCLAALPDRLRVLISGRYGSDHSIRHLAQRIGKSEAATKVTLSRVRKLLMGCIEKQLAAGS